MGMEGRGGREGEGYLYLNSQIKSRLVKSSMKEEEEEVEIPALLLGEEGERGFPSTIRREVVLLLPPSSADIIIYLYVFKTKAFFLFFPFLGVT